MVEGQLIELIKQINRDAGDYRPNAIMIPSRGPFKRKVIRMLRWERAVNFF